MTFTFTPLLVLFLMFSALSGIIIGTVWFHKARVPDVTIIKLMLEGLRGLLFSLLTFFSLVFLDTVFKYSFIGILSTGNWSYHLAIFILTTIVAFIILFGTVFTAPTVKTIVNFIIILSITIYSMWFSDEYLEGQTNLLVMGIKYILITVLLVNLIWTLFQFILRKDPLEQRKLWDYSAKYKKIFRLRVFVVLWILVNIEVILIFEGLGLLYWL